jgi:DNA-binding GntR family transcriptional regulator
MIKRLTDKQPKLLSQRVTELLRDAIIYGELRPGEKLNEAQLAVKLGISKSPLREALRNLESENLVETTSWKGTYVKMASVKEVEEVYLVLSMIEGTVSRLAAKNMDSKKERELKAILAELEAGIEKEDVKKSVVLSRKMHDFIIQASENDLLVKIHNSLRTQELMFSMVAQKGARDLLEVFREHIAIGEALLERDQDKAGALMVTHIENARLRALAMLEQRGDAGSVADGGSSDGPG